MRKGDTEPTDTLIASLAAAAVSLLAVAALATAALAMGDREQSVPAASQACHCATGSDDTPQPAER